MANFLKDLQEVFEEEIPEYVEIRALITRDWDDEKDPRDTPVIPYLDKVIPWETAAPLFDYEYDSGYGSRDCHNIYVWTKNFVFYIHEYDGSTQVRAVPRNPKI